MIRESNVRGLRRFTGTAADLAVAAEWVRSVCHIAYGPEEGERRFRALPAELILSLWAVRPPVEA